MDDHLELLQAYLELEQHERAAAFDGRPPDLSCLQRLKASASWLRLRAGWQSRRRLEEELKTLVGAAEELESLRLESDELQILRDQLMDRDLSVTQLKAELVEQQQNAQHHAEQQEQRLQELEESTLIAHQDMDAMSERLKMLEELLEHAGQSEAGIQALMSRLLP